LPYETSPNEINALGQKYTKLSARCFFCMSHLHFNNSFQFRIYIRNLCVIPLLSFLNDHNLSQHFAHTSAAAYKQRGSFSKGLQIKSLCVGFHYPALILGAKTSHVCTQLQKYFLFAKFQLARSSPQNFP
jgi:hypothetical protein